MTVVGDTSPVTYLVQLSLEHLLRDLYGHVLLPHEVVEELRHERTPEVVRAWALDPPEWVTVMSAQGTERAELESLDAGETAAILLALEVGADVLLMDEKKGTRAARVLGLSVTRTLGVLRDAERAGLVDAVAAYHRLREETSFRENAKLYQLFLNSLDRQGF